MSSTESDPRGNAVISRRAVVAGAAWSAPVIALAIASPMAAASTTPPSKVVVSCTTFHRDENYLNIKSTLTRADGSAVVGATVTVSISAAGITFDTAGNSGGSHYGFATFVTDSTGSFTGAVKIVTAKGVSLPASTFFVYSVTLNGVTTTLMAPVTVTKSNGNG